ncbi:MAG: exosortase [Lentimonas sp.]
MSDLTQAFSFKNLARDQIVAIGMLLGFAFYMIWDQFYWWGAREDYSFGYLVPLFAVYALYDRWPILRSYLVHGDAPSVETTSAAPSSTGLTLLCEWIAYAAFFCGLGLFGIGALLRSVTGPQNPASLAIAAGFSGLLLSVVFIMTKERVDGEPMSLKSRLMLTSLFMFPALIWLISAPMVSVLEKGLLVFLQAKVTVVVFSVFDVMGYEIEREGSVLILPDGQVGVEEACSGIRSLMACLFAGSFLAAVFLNRFWKKVLLVAAAMGFAVLTNMIRSLFLTMWAYHYGSTAIDEHWVLPLVGDIGSVHDVTGLAILGFTCVGLICLLPIFNFSLKQYEVHLDELDDAPEEE